MDTSCQSLLLAHGLSGLVALITFWIAGFAKKGSPLHVRAGKVYLLAMMGIVVTALPMSIIIAGRGKYGVAVFLAYLVVITVSAMWLGRHAIRSKRDQGAFRGRGYIAVAVKPAAHAAGFRICPGASAYEWPLNSSRPISMRRISLVPAPMAYSLASRSSRPVGYSLI